MIEFIIGLKIFLLGWTISRFEPISWLLDLLPDNLGFNIFKLLLTCSKCLCLWIGIIMCNIWIAMGVSLFMIIFEKTFGRWERKINI